MFIGKTLQFIMDIIVSPSPDSVTSSCVLVSGSSSASVSVDKTKITLCHLN